MFYQLDNLTTTHHRRPWKRRRHYAPRSWSVRLVLRRWFESPRWRAYIMIGAVCMATTSNKRCKATGMVRITAEVFDSLFDLPEGTSITSITYDPTRKIASFIFEGENPESAITFDRAQAQAIIETSFDIETFEVDGKTFFRFTH